MEVPDLGSLNVAELPPEMKAEALLEGEVRAGLRCAGCRERVSHGFRWWTVTAALVNGQGVINAAAEVTCARPDCRGAELMEEAVAVEEVRRRFLDEGAEGEALRRVFGRTAFPEGGADGQGAAEPRRPSMGDFGDSFGGAEDLG